MGGLQESKVISFFGNLTVHDTKKLFSRAALYIGAHGAGMTNMIFMSPQSFILEVRPDNVRRRVGSGCGKWKYDSVCVCVCALLRLVIMGGSGSGDGMDLAMWHPIL